MNKHVLYGERGIGFEVGTAINIRYISILTLHNVFMLPFRFPLTISINKYYYCYYNYLLK
jgi:hypothetical protein